MYDNIHYMMVLDAIRKTGNSVPYPTVDDWGYLDETVQALHTDGMLSISENHYVISEQGKKALLLFDDEIKNMISPLEVYKEVMVDGEYIDGRIPIASFMLHRKDRKAAILLLHTLIVGIRWKALMDSIVELNEIQDSQWQKSVADGEFLLSVLNDIDLNSWHQLGRTELEAAKTATWMLNPTHTNKGLVKIYNG